MNLMRTIFFLTDDEYDLALITVRRDQLASALSELATNKRIATLLFMLNNPTGSVGLAQALGRGRVPLGFPGAGGTRDGPIDGVRREWFLSMNNAPIIA